MDLEVKVPNDRPTIAILAQELTADSPQSYIAASYVKDIESAGARVVPIPTSFDVGTIEYLFKCVNGLLIPGGAAKLITSQYYKNAQHFFDLAIEANQQGDYFPIWGTCLGFEALPIMVAGTKEVLTTNDSVDISLPLDFTPLASESRMFRHMPSDLFKAVSVEPITYHFHKYGFTPDTFESNEELKRFFKVLSTNEDKSGQTFVSAIEAHEFPIYGVIWHPEKVNYEFKNKRQVNVPHSSNAVQVTQHMSNFFVNEARKSKHCFPSDEIEDKFLIYQYSPEIPNATTPVHVQANYQQVYMF